MHTNLKNPRNALLRLGVTVAMVVGLLLASTVGSTANAKADSVGEAIPGCEQTSAYSSAITVTQEPQGFKIHLTPTTWARVWGTGPQMDAVTWTMWHSIQGCVTGLYGDLADTIYQQLDCHRFFGIAAMKTGPTFDLESWHPALADPSTQGYWDTQCLELENVNTGSNSRVG